ncbi:MAG TPA: hypothetical protein VJU34_13810 [Phenylobacterium sp.]|nr:hypothetical protein [Phenylobacterium sp.]
MTTQLSLLFAKQFALCDLKSRETVAVIAEIGRKREHVDAAVLAAQQMGAAVVLLEAPSLSHPELPPYRSDDRGVGALIAAAAQCDLVVDLTVGGLIHSDVRTRITGQGKRMLFVAEGADVLERLIGDDIVRARVEGAAERLRAGRTLHVTSAAGTDLKADISAADLPVTMQWGYVDEPGRWDHWPSGFVACFPRDRSAQGRIVLQAGDILLPWIRAVQAPVTLEVVDGYITSLEGEGADAFLLRDYFEAWDDPEVWAVSHMGWGVHPAARFAAVEVYPPRSLYGQEFRSAEGNFMWSTGSNRYANRFTPAHLDIPMRGCTVMVDDHMVVEAGRLAGTTQ